MFPIELALNDPASAAIALLLAAKAIEGAGEEIGRTGVDFLQRASGGIWRRIRGDAKAEAALRLVEAAPTDVQAVRLLAGVLAARAEGDHEFAGELSMLTAEAEQVGLLRRANVHGGIFAKKVIQKGRHNTLVAGDQINEPAPTPDE
jgi:hypothetical protein